MKEHIKNTNGKKKVGKFIRLGYFYVVAIIRRIKKRNGFDYIERVYRKTKRGEKK